MSLSVNQTYKVGGLTAQLCQLFIRVSVHLSQETSPQESLVKVLSS